MPLATPGQYAQMLDAAERRYAYAAVNVTSSESLNAALRGFQLADADGIIQITVGAGEYMSGTGANDALLGARALARYAHVVAEASPVLIALHTDHCPPAHVDDWLHPLLAESGRRVALGATPLFHSHMFDGSTLPLDGNLRIASALLKKCSELDIVLRRGRRRGRRDRGGPRTGATSSTRQPAIYSVSPTRWGSASAGATWSRQRSATCTEPTPPGNVVPRPEISQAGQEALAAAYPGARFQYVFHDSSGSGERELAHAVSFGVVKVNVDTDNQYAFTRALAGHVLDHWQGVLKVDGGMGDKHRFDPRAWVSSGEAAMAKRVRQAFEQFGSAGRSLAASASASDRPGPSLIDLD